MKKQQAPSLTARIVVSAAIILALLFFGIVAAALFSDDVVTGNVAVIAIEGPIMVAGGDPFGDVVSSSTEIAAEIDEAASEPSIKAIVLMINSPGGSAVASDEIAQAVKDAREQNITVVAVIREVGASGAYWIASSTDHIVANRMSITGSIGVIGSYLEFDEFIKDWNVSYNRLVAGERKDIGDPFMNLSSADRAFLQGKLNRIHAYFIDEVAANRGLPRDSVAAVADGSFLLGVEALELGLIDELGGKTEAVLYVERIIGEEAELVEYGPETTWIDELLGLAGLARAPRAISPAAYIRPTAQHAEAAARSAPVPMLT
jgi:protease-4